MNGETNLSVLLKKMTPELNEGEFVFCTIAEETKIDNRVIIGSFREKEGLTIIVERQTADSLNLSYHFISAWITLTIHSSLDAVGLTAVFSKALADEGISCNVVAAYYHDHIFVAKQAADKAMEELRKLSVSF